ncbi:MAG: hypothetical protein R3C45_17565 [Phycisphaerales bacterium]
MAQDREEHLHSIDELLVKEKYDQYEAVVIQPSRDILHENFVPQFSEIGGAEPKLRVLIGVWVLFGSSSLTGVFFCIILLSADLFKDSWFYTCLILAATALELALNIAIIAYVTRKYVRYRHKHHLGTQRS